MLKGKGIGFQRKADPVLIRTLCDVSIESFWGILKGAF